MNFIFITIVILGAFLLQSVIFPTFGWFSQSFDLLIIIVLFLNFHFSHYVAVPVIFLIGCLMDSLSMTPFFHYTASYLWIYFFIQLLQQVIFKKSLFFIVIVSGACILLQHLLIIAEILIRDGRPGLSLVSYSQMGRQMIWGILLIPPGFRLLEMVWQRWEKAAEARQTD